MIQFDHVAITVKNLEQSIKFYENLGYTLQNQFIDEEYRWANLELGLSMLEIFEPLNNNTSKIEHLAYSFTDDKEAFEFASKRGYKIEDKDIFYGDLNRKSFFIEDDNGISIQLIKKCN